MTMYKLIKIKDSNNAGTHLYVPGLIKLPFLLKEIKHYGFKLLKERMNGWTICWVENESVFNKAIETLEQLKHVRKFEYEVM